MIQILKKITTDQTDLFGSLTDDPAGKIFTPRPPAAVRHAHIKLVHGDFLSHAPALVEDGSVDVIITSPPYNIGIGYSTYQDDLPREDYLAWTDEWAREAKRCLAEKGSLFLNVGVRPTEPWAAWEIANVFRHHFALQNVIHWIKSISISKRDVGNYPGITQDVTVGHYKPINSDRFVNDQHEYLFHLTHAGDVELDRLAIGVPYQDASNAERWKKGGGRAALPRQHLVRPLSHDQVPRQGPPAPGLVPHGAPRALPAPARAGLDPPRDGSLHGSGLDGPGRRPIRPRCHRFRRR